MDIVDRIKSANPIFGQQEGRNQFLKFIAQKRSEVKQNESSHQYEVFSNQSLVCRRP